MNFLELAEENRRAFLEPYKARFDTAKTEKQRSEIVIELLRLEPSHLDEPWIREAVIRWMRDHAKCSDYLHEAFVARKGRDRFLEISTREAVDNLVFHAVEETKKRDGISSTKEACARLAISEQGQRLYSMRVARQGEEPEKWLEKAHARGRENLKAKGPIPWPYYGRDIKR